MAWKWDEYAQTDLQELSRQARVANAAVRTAGSTKAQWGTPKIIGKRYAQPYYKGKRGIRRPLFIQNLYDHLREAGLDIPKNRPWNCSGPREKGRFEPGKWPCDQPLICGSCWDRQRHKAALKGAQRHLHGEKVVKFSQTLPLIRNDPEAVAEARKAYCKALKDLGWTNQTVWVQTFGEHPWEGPKGHLDGVVSGDGEWPIVHGKSAATGIMHGALADAVEHAFGPKHELVMSARAVDPASRRGMTDLVSGLKYAGRETFPTLRILAGAMDWNCEIVKFTNVHGGNCRFTRKIETLPNPQRLDGLWTYNDVYQWAATAAEWNSVIGRGGRTRTVKPKPLLQRRFEEIVPLGYWRLKRPESWPRL